MIFNKIIREVIPNKILENNTEIFNHTETTKVLEVYNYFKLNNKSVVIIVDSKKEAEKFYDNFPENSDVYIYPEIDVLKNFTGKSNDLEQISIEILNRLLNKENIILIIPIISLFRTIKSPNDFNNSINISLTDYISFSDLPKRLIDLGYLLVDTVENIGEFSKRGSIIDIYSPLNKYPVRLDYFDEEIDSIRTFDIITQKTENTLEEIKIYPNGEFFLTSEDKNKVVSKLLKELENSNLKNFDNYNDIKKYIKSKIDIFKDTGKFDELHSFSNYIYENEVYSIVDYIDYDIPIFFNNFSKISMKLENLKEYFIEHLKDINNNYIFQNIIDENSINKLTNSSRFKIYLSNIKSNEKYISNFINYNAIDVPFFSGEEQFTNELKNKIKHNYKIMLLINNIKQKDYIEKVLFDYNLYDYISVGLSNGKISIEQADNIIKGFELVNEKFILITVNEIFKEASNKKKKRVNFQNTNSEKIRNYQDLNEGDYIVHIHHGIGIYQGIENIEVSGIYKDFLKISYEGSDIIYVDVDNMKYIQKYKASSDNRKPKLNKLGTKKWQQTKYRVKKEIEDISEELIKLYIKRELNKGFSFSPDSSIQQEFEQDFLYEATADQIKATDEIKKDMEKDRPMDRLLCGDVGFGKTEVAMRVAFKAICDNKQVAVLVPTTLLAEQHYNNFLNRFKNFPVNIEVVSRFKTAKEITAITKRLKNGEIDIIVGTHKLLNDKFYYKDLGLLIIDEEQRFGVKHKEKIKHLKNTIDVLTLSATPIPRTLHMSLVGIRDLSVIETPPTNRQPIQTFVMSENPNIVREAVLNEIERNGQIFYVYNKVETIEEKYLELKKLLPEINIAYAHGRMTQKELEDIMIDVINKEYDMLISTTIIETGIDISNVNTLIIEDADKFGLSQLYQIRGRVGRSSREAYAYLMYKPFKLLTETAEKRLSAIKSFTSLGSGFKIAMQDLTIRGAGDVLGGKQHGFIDSVGYTLYSQILEREIQDKKEILEPILQENRDMDISYYENIIKEKSTKAVEDIFEVVESKVNIKLNVSAYIPKDYINNDADKIYFYKLLNNVTSEEKLHEIVDELIDRFSDFEEEVENLINITNIRILSENILIDSIVELANKVKITFKKEAFDILNGKMLFEILSPYKNIRIAASDNLIIEISKDSSYSIKNINKILKQIVPSFMEV
ncbi:transcription-repair coupling factor [Gemelliphila palaticanis]|uniref:Transcription-repair-coupling factor n=1 Tax=Gemelliphila palaticanis TaxID=81950 RepID=A0ABX2SYB1_9BACL|nr:transcription-repair coupling factor [Gemella palaticanis]MBF0715313.1 transcription-repair coupling factor [Gemella palaticanis]NYS47243.1 transcription-repair coupling factor [Gemella palaticanis]